MRRGAGRENVRKQRGKDKAQNREGRRDFGAWGKVKKIKRKGGLQSRSENEQMYNQRTEWGDTRGRNLGNSGAA